MTPAVLSAGGVAAPCAVPIIGLFDATSVDMSVASAILVLLVAVTLVLRYLRGRGAARTRVGRWLVPLAALVTVLFAVLGTAWIWQLRSSYIASCVDYVNAAPFSEEQGFALPPILVLLAMALGVAWLVAAVVGAFRRRGA